MRKKIVDSDNNNNIWGFADYRTFPYALGDTLTWLQNLHVLAKVHNSNGIDLKILTLPETPASKLQPSINSENFFIHLDNLMPIFSCCELVTTIEIIQEEKKWDNLLSNCLSKNFKSFPTYWDIIKEKHDYSSHNLINNFFRINGYLPRLSSGKIYSSESRAFFAKALNKRKPILFHVRQRLNSYEATAPHRDGTIKAWLDFLNYAKVSLKDHVFVLLGGFDEWDRRLARFDNVVIPRTYGLTVAHELAMIFDGTPFMGNSSGFSAAATFSNTPYIILNYDHAAAKEVDIELFSPQYPFATSKQFISWEKETLESLKYWADKLLSSEK